MQLGRVIVPRTMARALMVEVWGEWVGGGGRRCRRTWSRSPQTELASLRSPGVVRVDYVPGGELAPSFIRKHRLFFLSPPPWILFPPLVFLPPPPV